MAVRFEDRENVGKIREEKVVDFEKSFDKYILETQDLEAKVGVFKMPLDLCKNFSDLNTMEKQHLAKKYLNNGWESFRYEGLYQDVVLRRFKDVL